MKYMVWKFNKGSSWLIRAPEDKNMQYMTTKGEWITMSAMLVAGHVMQGFDIVYKGEDLEKARSLSNPKR